jgi:hypothetical protein
MGLEFDGTGFTQGVSDAQPGTSLPVELQRFIGEDTLLVVQKMPVVLPSGKDLIFFGLAFDPSLSDQTKQAYYATDTSGNIYKLAPPLLVSLGVDAPSVTYEARSARISSVTPNPLREAASIGFELKSRQHVLLELYSTDGSHRLDLFEGDLEAGTHTVALQGADLSSGIYYLSLRGGAGERDVRPIVIMK